MNDLTLIGAELSSVPENLLVSNSELLKLNLNQNKLKTIPLNFLRNQSSLNELSLGFNMINNLAPRTFMSLTNLLTLYLNDNELTAVVPNWFQNLSKLEVLSLNNNKISQLPPDAFRDLLNLKSLWLGGNQIEVVGANLGISKNLKLIDFWYNNITAINEELFVNSSISDVRLKGNKCINKNFMFHRNEDKNNAHLQECYGNFKNSRN